MDYKELVRKAVEIHGITRYRLAQLIGVQPSNIYSWEKGRTKPDGDNAIALYRAATEKEWSGREDLNLRHLRPERASLLVTPRNFIRSAAAIARLYAADLAQGARIAPSFQ